MKATYPVSSYIPAGKLSDDQLRAVRSIEKVAKRRRVPPEVAMAMVANAKAESNLDPCAVGKVKPWTGCHHQPGVAGGTDYIGLFQLGGGSNQGGRGMSVSKRKDPEKSTKRIIDEMDDARSMDIGSRHLPPYGHEHPLDAYDRGVRDVGHLTAMFQFYVERPFYAPEDDAYRRGLAALLFPTFVLADSERPPRRSSRLPGPGAPAAGPTRTRRSLRSQRVAKWTSDDDRIGLLNARGNLIQQGLIPAGTYQAAWDGIPVPGFTVPLKAGQRYHAVVREGSVVFDPA